MPISLGMFVTSAQYTLHITRKIQRQHILHQLVGLFIISNDTKCTLLFSLAIIGDAFWNVNSENDKMHFRTPYKQCMTRERADCTCSCSPTLLNNACHLIILSLSYLHRYSWVPHSPAETYELFCFCLFLMCYHIVFLKNYIYNHNAPQLPAAGG